MSGLLGGLGGDAGLLAAGAAAVFLLYTAATMAAAGGGRKKRSSSKVVYIRLAILKSLYQAEYSSSTLLWKRGLP